jgi:hypothetical protein
MPLHAGSKTVFVSINTSSVSAVIFDAPHRASRNG